MNTAAAFNFTVKKAKELENTGIKVNSKLLQKLVDYKTNGSNPGDPGISPDKWQSVLFMVSDESQLEKVFLKEKELSDLGIHFDTGTVMGFRMWELDHSFFLRKHAGKLNYAAQKISKRRRTKKRRRH